MSRFPELPEYVAGTAAIKVGVFCDRADGKGCRAYTMWYDSSWKNCCEHVMRAKNGTEAKKLAIAEHKDMCIFHPAVS